MYNVLSPSETILIRLKNPIGTYRVGVGQLRGSFGARPTVAEVVLGQAGEGLELAGDERGRLLLGAAPGVDVVVGQDRQGL